MAYMMRLSQKNKELQAELRDLRAQVERVLTKVRSLQGLTSAIANIQVKCN
jgi:uncharacterized protein YlxW (UPF0749 family)